MWNMLSVPQYTPLAFSSQSIYLGNKYRGPRLQRYHVLRGDTVGPGAKEHTYGTLGHGVCNRGKKGYSGLTKEPGYKCAESAGAKNCPK